MKGPFLVLCNHNTDWDPLLLACAFMVASIAKTISSFKASALEF